MLETINYLKNAGKIIPKVKPLAAKYHNLTGRPLGATGEIAEYEVIRLLNLECCEARQSGYDALRKNGKRLEKIQIKGRVLQDKSKASQRLGSISLNKEWDFVLLVILDANFNPQIIYEANRKKIEQALSAPGSKARNDRGQLSVSKFKSISKVIWSFD